jgi:hypothetical protein
MQTANISLSAYLGIDVAKEKVDCVLLVDSHSSYQVFANTPAGFEQLSDWLRREQVSCVHACLEATGSYSEALARALLEQGHTVSVLNPAVLVSCMSTVGCSPLLLERVDQRVLQFVEGRENAIGQGFAQVAEDLRGLIELGTVAWQIEGRRTFSPSDTTAVAARAQRPKRPSSKATTRLSTGCLIRAPQFF